MNLMFFLRGILTIFGLISQKIVSDITNFMANLPKLGLAPRLLL